MIQKYVFDRSFDEDRDRPKPPKPIPPPPQLPEKSFEDGFKDGFQKGIESQAQKREETILQVLEHVENTFTKMMTDIHGQRSEIARTAISLVKNIVEKIFPSLTNNPKLAEQDLETKLIPVIQEFTEGRVKVFVHKSVSGFIESRLRSITRVPFDVVVDPNLAPGDCRLCWNEAGFESFRDRLREEICVLLDDMVVTAK